MGAVQDEQNRSHRTWRPHCPHWVWGSRSDQMKTAAANPATTPAAKISTAQANEPVITGAG
jgi:hypothetical protein